MEERPPAQQVMVMLRKAVGLVAHGLQDLQGGIGPREAQRLLLGLPQDVDLLLAFGEGGHHRLPCAGRRDGRRGRAQLRRPAVHDDQVRQDREVLGEAAEPAED